MKAIVQHRYGPPEVLAPEEIDKPVVGEKDVLIRVHAAGLNLADGVIVRGVPYVARLGAELRRPRHGVRGTDVAGTVTEVGSKVTDLHPGDEVFGSCGDLYVAGAFAEYARPARQGRPEAAHDHLRAGRGRSHRRVRGPAGAAGRGPRAARTEGPRQRGRPAASARSPSRSPKRSAPT